MMNVCSNCGKYRADKTIDSEGPIAICPVCQHKHPFQQLPLLIVCGPNGAGKTTVCKRIVGTVKEVVILDADILWRPEFNDPDNHYRDFFETWLRLGKNIGQSGRPLVLFNAGSIPDNIEPCVERRYHAEIHYLALTCEDDILVERLRERPAWRQSHDKAFITEQIKFNHWLKEQAKKTDLKIKALDTTHVSINMTVELVATWIRERIL
ncbi:MAG: AAA family ATPase [Chloroflexi bacterium]|nr:AAA family ATPase [Chloroflexota bacterium]